MKSFPQFVDEVYEDISDLADVQDVSMFDGKIGRFKKHERIFFIEDVHL
ncbi:MAG: hypothetical protein IE887_08845 [Campylobacterales bacterium]|nr:hypothetical protein [Campylobacterales bacterium]